MLVADGNSIGLQIGVRAKRKNWIKLLVGNSDSYRNCVQEFPLSNREKRSSLRSSEFLSIFKRCSVASDLCWKLLLLYIGACVMWSAVYLAFTFRSRQIEATPEPIAQIKTALCDLVKYSITSPIRPPNNMLNITCPINLMSTICLTAFIFKR